jgi:hypothetical protein
VQAHGLRIAGSTLLVPLYSAAGQLRSVQRVYAKGDGFEKRNLGPKTGCFFTIGQVNRNRTRIALLTRARFSGAS